MAESRKSKVLKNSFIGISTQILITIFGFLSKTVFIRSLGVDYLGVSGLYSNLLTVLSLSDLGMYTVMVYSLYKPLSQQNTGRITFLMSYYQKLYLIIACVILGLGISLIPFLRFLIKDSSLPYGEIVQYYILYLLNSACSYIAISKSTLFRADQKVYVIQLTVTCTTIAKDLAQIICLWITHNFVIYLVIQILATLLQNIILTVLANRQYPFLKRKSDVDEDPNIKTEIFGNMKATFLYKIGNMAMNSTDNILISAIIGTAAVGYYSNYVTIYTIINNIIMILIGAMTGSIGNYLAVQDQLKKYRLFKTMLLMFYFIASMCCACYLCGMEDFITIWIGPEYVIEGSFLMVLVAYRFIFCSIHPIWIFREASGIFLSTRYMMLITAGINMILSIILGQRWRLTGIIAATSLSYLMVQFWYEPKLLCQKVFGLHVSKYWKYVCKLLAVSAVILSTGYLLRFLRTSNLILLFCKFAFCFVISVMMFVVCFYKTEEFAFFLALRKQLPAKFIRKKKDH